jgi:hypothetical protein
MMPALAKVLSRSTGAEVEADGLQTSCSFAERVFSFR